MPRRQYYKGSPEQLRQRVRAYPRDDLLRGIARVAALETRQRYDLENRQDEKFSVIREGHMVHLAGLCVTHCNNYRASLVNDAAIENLIDKLYHVWHPELEGDLTDEVWQKILSRIAFQQMPYQISPWEPLARAICLFGNDRQFGEPVFEDGRWETILGVELEDLLRIGFIMYGAATIAPCTPRALLEDDTHSAWPDIGAERALQVVDTWLARSVNEHQKLGREENYDPNDLWRYNPFYEWPIATIDATYVTPSPQGVLQRLGPQGLYFIGRDAVDADVAPKQFQEFTRRLGERFQQYVGVQLRYLQHVRIHPEIVYDDDQRSVDYIIETPELLILVEVKSVAPNIDTRSGIFPDRGDVKRNLEYACNQISRSSTLIQKGHEAFPSLNGRQMRGLVVTREQYFNLAMPLFENLVQPATIPTTIVSSHQLETAIPVLSCDEKCGQTLLDAMSPDISPLAFSFGSLPNGKNTLLHEIGEEWFSEHFFSDVEDTRSS